MSIVLTSIIEAQCLWPISRKKFKNCDFLDISEKILNWRVLVLTPFSTLAFFKKFRCERMLVSKNTCFRFRFEIYSLSGLYRFFGILPGLSKNSGKSEFGFETYVKSYIYPEIFSEIGPFLDFYPLTWPTLITGEIFVRNKRSFKVTLIFLSSK